MQATSPKAAVVWLRALDRLLTRGSTPTDLASLSQMLSQAPQGWHELSARARGWRAMPCWARALSNLRTEPEWIAEAISLCTKAGAVHDEHVVGGKVLPEPVFMALTNKLGDLNTQAYANYVMAELVREGPVNSFPSRQIAWLGRMFARSSQWKDDSVSPRIVMWQFLETFPGFRSSPLSEKVWAMGLGLTSSETYAARALEFAAMNGLEGNVILTEESLPSASLKQWPSQELGPWRPAPAWGWALLRGIFRGSRMLVGEVRRSQSSPWDPNAFLPGQQRRVGDWLLETSLLPSRPASSPGAMVVELDELGFAWGEGALGERAIDVLKANGLGPGILGRERYDQIVAQAEESLMDTALPQAIVGPSGPVRERF